MQNKKILISGGGIAGLTLAYYLGKAGFSPVVIEKANSIRNGGYMIDFFSSGLFVSEDMGIIEALKAKDYGMESIQLYSALGKKGSLVSLKGFREALDGKFFNLLRTDLVEILYEKAKEYADIRFSTSITSIEEHPQNLLVHFNDGTKEAFDLLIGADGLSSNVRTLCYKKEEVTRLYLGDYVAGVKHSVPLNISSQLVDSISSPKHQVMNYSVDDKVYISIFAFKTPLQRTLNKSEQIALLQKEFSTFSSPVPEILSSIKTNPLYFDEVTQIRIKGSWSKNRVALVGDAAYCITLLSGQGASMAMTGAYLLAKHLTQEKGDHSIAFKSYETELRPFIEKMQEKAIGNANSYLPSSKFSLALRNLLLPILFSKPFTPLLIWQLGADDFFKK